MGKRRRKRNRKKKPPPRNPDKPKKQSISDEPGLWETLWAPRETLYSVDREIQRMMRMTIAFIVLALIPLMGYLIYLILQGPPKNLNG